MARHRRYPTIYKASAALSMGLVALAVLLTGFEALAKGGRGGFRVNIEVNPYKGKLYETPKAPARPPKYEPINPAAARQSDPIGWKSSTRMPGSARLRPIGRPFSVPPGARPITGRVPGPKIVTILPKPGPTYQYKEAYRNTFDKPPTEAVTRDLDALIGRFGEQAQNLGSLRDGPEQLRQAFRNATAEGHASVIVVGHSIGTPSGLRELKLTDGSKVSLEEIYKWAAAEGLECRIATCYGKDFGIDAHVALGRVARLLADVAWPVELIAPKPTEAATASAWGNGDASTHYSYSGYRDDWDDWDDWDERLSRRRDELGYSDVVLVGVTRGGDGQLHLWESVRARPTWLAISAWMILIAGTLANASVMRWNHRQEIGSDGSIEEIEREASERFRRSRKLARATVIATSLALAVATVAAMLVRQEQGYNAATGQTTRASLVNVPAPIGVALMALSALASRVDPGRAWAARLIYALSGAIAGTVAMFVRALKFVGGFGLALVLWVNLIRSDKTLRHEVCAMAR